MDETMTNPERDKLIRETHEAVTVLVATVKRHDKTLYGNGQPGLCKDFTEVQTAQRECPARKANQPATKIALGAMILAGIGVAWKPVAAIIDKILQ
jgi:hypothetical protein